MSLTRTFSVSRALSLLRSVSSLQSSSLSTDAAAITNKRTMGRRTKQQEVPAKVAEPEVTARAADVIEVESSSEVKRAVELEPMHVDVKDSKRTPRPSEIPWQVKIANFVHLIGSIGVVPQIGTSDEGVYSAVSVLVREKNMDLPQFWIPIIFHGELAETAVRHLKENDTVYVTGQLSGDAPPLAIKDCQSTLQIIVHSISFVQALLPKQKTGVVNEQDNRAFCDSDNVKINSGCLDLREDPTANSHKWRDNKGLKLRSSSADFQHKDNGHLLRVSSSTPDNILSKLEDSDFKKKLTSDNFIHDTVSGKKIRESHESLWCDLDQNPHQWLDFRLQKDNGSVKFNYPDFKHKSTLQGLWLNGAPNWLLAKLHTLEFDVQSRQIGKGISTSFPKQAKNDEESWKNLVEKPGKWWDNRSSKLKPGGPDFKNKETGEALWLNSFTPSWVLSKLPLSGNEKKVSG